MVCSGHWFQSLHYKGEVGFSPPQDKCHKDTLIFFLFAELSEPLLTGRQSGSNWGKPQCMYRFDRSLHNALDKGTTERLQLCRGSPYLLLSQRMEEQRGLGVPYVACAPS